MSTSVSGLNQGYDDAGGSSPKTGDDTPSERDMKAFKDEMNNDKTGEQPEGQPTAGQENENTPPAEKRIANFNSVAGLGSPYEDMLRMQFKDRKKFTKETTKGYMQKHFDEAAGSDGELTMEEWEAFIVRRYNQLAGDDGVIDSEEAKQDADLARDFEKADTNFDGVIDHREFFIYVTRSSQGQKTYTPRKEETNGYMEYHYDAAAGNDGELEGREWRRFLNKQFNSLSGDDSLIDVDEAKKDPKLYENFNDVDRNKDGFIDRKEYLQYGYGNNEYAPEDTDQQSEENIQQASDAGMTSSYGYETGSGLVMVGNFEKRMREAELAGEEMVTVEVQRSDGTIVWVKVPKSELDKNPFYAEEYVRMKEDLLYFIIQEEALKQNQMQSQETDAGGDNNNNGRIRLKTGVGYRLGLGGAGVSKIV